MLLPYEQISPLLRMIFISMGVDFRLLNACNRWMLGLLSVVQMFLLDPGSRCFGEFELTINFVFPDICLLNCEEELKEQKG